MSRELRLCPGVGGRKCGAFLSSLDRDPHPTCTRCRGKICTKDLTCDFCAGWSSSQWEAFAKKRTYKERKRSRPSGSLPPATKTSPCARTSLEVLYPEASSSSSLPSGGQAKRGESRDAPGVTSREASSPPARPRSSERGGSVSGRSSGARERAPVSSAPSGAGGGGGGALLVRSGRPLPALLPRWPLPAHHCTLCDVVSQESLPWSAPIRDPPVFPDLRIEEQGRIVEPAFGRAAPVAGLGDLALAPLPARGQAVESVVAGTRLGHCPPACGRCVTGRGLLTAIGHVAFAIARCLGEIGRGLRTATALAGIALDVTGRDLRIAAGLGGSVRDPLLVGEVTVTACGHAIPLAALVTAHGHGSGRLFPLTVRSQRIEAGKPDVSNGRMGRL